MEDESLSNSLQHSHHLHQQHHHHLQNSGHHIQHRHVASSVGDDGGEEEELDPRIQIELEKLNRATEEINRLELELDDARASFRQVLSDSSQRLNGLAKKLGTSVDKARPYYDARMKLKEAHLESQKAALRFERACSMHEAAKEMVQLAEEGYKRREEDLDPTWQEMLNHATMKVNDAERERMESEDNHQSTTLNFKKREEEVQKMQRDLKRAITKSKPYFEMKAKFNQVMEDHKRNVSRLEEDVASTKALYSEALRNLEAISDDIHRQRLERRQKMQLGIRGAGVGAESPSPPPSWDKGINIDGSASHMMNSDGDEMCSERTVRKRWKEQGIVGFDLPLCHQSSVSDDHDLDSLKSDPLNLVVFKTDSYQHPHHSHHTPDNNNFSPPSVIRNDPRHARNHSYRQAMETDNNNGDALAQRINDAKNDKGVDTQVIVNNSSALTNSTCNSDKSQQLRREVEAMQSSLSRAQEWVNKSPVPQQRRFIKSKSLIDAASASSSPSTTPLSSAAVANSDKSTASPPPTTSCHTDTLASSLTTEAMKIMASNARLREETENSNQSPPPQPSNSNTKVSSALSVRLLQQQQQQELPTTGMVKGTAKNDNISIQIQPHLQQSSQASPSPPIPPPQQQQHYPQYHHHPYHPKSSPRSVSSTTSDASSPISGSPSGKSPKLQGLILRVDAAGIMASPSPTSSSSVSNNPYSKHQGVCASNPSNNQVVITTKPPSLGVSHPAATGQPHQQGGEGVGANLSSSLLSSSSQKSPISPSFSSSSSYTNPSDGMASSPIMSSSNSAAPTTTVTSPFPPRPTLIPNTRSSSSLSLGGFKFPTSSKAPQTSTAFHLPSPTQPRSTNLSIPPPLAIRQKISPTPPSPSADRVSVLSGRSDSSKGGLLRPPSDSSDTESIASTGPMLDDDQVEFLTLDFNEQSISSSAPQEELEEGDMNELEHSRLQRGNWSRMSLPPRLSHLGGYLERTRNTPVDTDDSDDVVAVVDNLSPQKSVDEVEGGLVRDGDSVETTKEVTDKDEVCVKPEDDVEGVNFMVIEGGGEECGETQVSVNVRVNLDKNEEEEEVEGTKAEENGSGYLISQTDVEATVVVTGEGTVEVMDGVEDSTDS